MDARRVVASFPGAAELVVAVSAVPHSTVSMSLLSPPQDLLHLELCLQHEFAHQLRLSGTGSALISSEEREKYMQVVAEFLKNINK